MNEALRRLSAARPLDLGAEGDFSLGALDVHPATREVSAAGGRRKTIEPRVMQVLVVLARANGLVISRDQLIERCWGGRIVGDDAINSCLAKVRVLAEYAEEPSFEIETIPRVGYRLRGAPPVAAESASPAQSVSGAANARSPGRRRWPLLIGAGMPIALACAALFIVLHRQTPPLPQGRPIAQAQRGQKGEKPSIAVLPFLNLTAEKGTAYFAEGIQDEILTRLAKIGSLKVISRTSTEPYAGKSQNLRAIAKQLGVQNILEGNVQRAGNRVRINVQLIRASTDSHLWAEDYDRTLNDVFSVETEVARSIADTLAARMTGSETKILNAGATSNPKAYDLYLRGLVLMDRPLDPGAPEGAAAILAEAVRADPGFALAWSKLSIADSFLAFAGAAGRLEPARQALEKAQALAPELPETQVAAAFFTYYGESDYRGALKAFEALRRRWPNNVDVLRALGLLSRRVGRAQDTISYFREALALDPHNILHYTGLADVLDGMHRFADALRIVDKGLSIWPGNSDLLNWKTGVLLDDGQLDDAAKVLAEAPASDPQAPDLRTVRYMYLRRYADGAHYLEYLLAAPDFGKEPEERKAHLFMHAADFQWREGHAGAARNNFTKARDIFLKLLKAAPRDSGVLLPLAYAYAGLNDIVSATRIADRGMADYPLSRDTIEGVNCATLRAVVAARFNDRAAAIKLLRQIAPLPWSPSPASLRLDPNFDNLRGDPEFEKLAHADGK